MNPRKPLMPNLLVNMDFKYIMKANAMRIEIEICVFDQTSKEDIAITDSAK